MKLIHNFRPRYLIMTGIAASLKNQESHGFGDILVIDESWDGGAGKISEDDKGNTVFLQGASHLRLDPDVKEKMRIIKDDKTLLRKIKDDWSTGDQPNTELQIHIGSVDYSGDTPTPVSGYSPTPFRVVISEHSPTLISGYTPTPRFGVRI